MIGSLKNFQKQSTKRSQIFKEPIDEKNLENELNKEEIFKKEFKKMEQFMLQSGVVQTNHISSKLEEWDDKLYGDVKNNLTIDEELEFRKSKRDMKKRRKGNEDYYLRFLQPRNPDQNVVNRLQQITASNQKEREDILDLYNKIATSYRPKEKQVQEKQYKFPLNENCTKLVLMKNIFDEVGVDHTSEMNPDNTEQQDQLATQALKSSTTSVNQKKYDSYFENDDDDDDDSDNDSDRYSQMDIDNMTERSMKSVKSPKSAKSGRSLRSNYERASIYSKSRIQAEKEWEYNSNRDYNIDEIQKLSEEIETQRQSVHTLENQKEDESQKGNEEGKDHEKEQKEKKQQKRKKMKILKIKQERSYEEFQALNIHDKIDFTVNNDYFGFTFGNVIHPENQVQYYRDITCQARDLLSIDKDFRGIYYEQDRLSLLEIEDVYIDLSQVNFQDITNIVSDRVSESMIQNYINPQYIAENYNKFSYVPEKSSNQVVDKLSYIQSLQDVKKSQYVEMKTYYQKMKAWDNKTMQVSHRDIINETKAVTDWILEDLHHVRKATISSFELDFLDEVSKVVQTQLYRKFELKLLLLLQIILYRENIPSYKVKKDRFGRPEKTEEEQVLERMKIDKQREEEEQKFFNLFTPETQLVQDLKKLLKNMKKIGNKTVDGRSKTELLRIFLVDYNEIVKYKTEQLNKIKKIDSELGDINVNFSQIQGKSLYERLFETRIGHIKNEVTDEQSDQMVLHQLNQRREVLQKQRDSILLNSAQIFPITEEQIQDTSDQISPVLGAKAQEPRSPESPSRGKLLLEKAMISKTKQIINANRVFKIFGNSQSPSNKASSQENTDSMPNSNNYRGISQNVSSLTENALQKSASRNGLTPVKSSNLLRSAATPTPQKARMASKSPISTASRVRSDMNTTTNVRSMNKSSTQRSLQSNFTELSAQYNPDDRSSSRLTNRQIYNATPTQNFYDRESLDEPRRRTPDSYFRQESQNNTSSKENEIKQIKLFKQARTQEFEMKNSVPQKYPVVSQFESHQNNGTGMSASKSKSPMHYNPREKQGFVTPKKVGDDDLLNTKKGRMKSQASTTSLMNTSQASMKSTPLRQKSSNYNNSSFNKSASKTASNANPQSSASQISSLFSKQSYSQKKY